MATIGADATAFNSAAEKVIAKSEQMKSKVAQATSRQIDFSRGTGLANDPSKMFSEEAHKSKAEKMRALEKAAAAREVEDMRRLGRAGAEAKALGAKEGRNAKNFAQEAVKEEAAALGIGAKNMSALGGAAKMFGAAMAITMAEREAEKMMVYARKVDELSKTLNSSRTDIQAWDIVAQDHGRTIDDVGSLLEKINKNRVNALSGNEPLQADAFKQLGVTKDMLQHMTSSQLAQQIGKAFEGGGNTEQMTAALMRVGEESAIAFAAAFQGGITKAFDDAKHSSSILSDGMIERFKVMGERWISIGRTIGTTLGTVLYPVFELVTDAAEKLSEVAKVGAAFAKGWWGGKGLFNGAGFDAAVKELDEQDKKHAERNNRIQRAALGLDNRGTDPDLSNITNKAEDAARKKAKHDEDMLMKQARHEADREARENAALGKHSVNALQQMGGFLGNFATAQGPEVAAMNAQVRSEQHLAELVAIARARKENPGADIAY